MTTAWQEAFKYAGVKIKRELVNPALKEFVEHHPRKDVRELFGQVEIAPEYTYKALGQTED